LIPGMNRQAVDKLDDPEPRGSKTVATEPNPNP
jgi:hypothetical protein